MYSPATFENTCPRGGLRMILDPKVAHAPDMWARIMFEAPSSTQIVAYRIWRSARVQPGSTAEYWFSGREKSAGSWYFAGPGCKGSKGCTRVGDPSKPLSDANLWQATPATPISGVDLYISCGLPNSGSESCPAASFAAEAWLHRAEVTLADDVAPTFDTKPTGTLADARTPVSGTVPVSLQASDRGGGLVRARVEVDGHVVATEPLGGADACSPPYTRRVPCPLRAAQTIAVDTTALADGSHTVRLLVDDVAGNTTATDPWTIVTRNTPPDRSCDVPLTATGGLNMTARLTIKQRKKVRTTTKSKKGKKRKKTKTVIRTLSRTRMTTRYASRRKITLRGRLTGPDRRPIAGAPVCVVERTDVSSDRPKVLARLTTDADGRFAVRVRRGPSRQLWAIHNSANAAVADRVTLNVIPRVTLRPSKRRLRNGQLLVLRGRVAGGPIPKRGVLVQAMAWRGTHWQPFGRGRARGKNGTFRIRYRFTGTRGRQRYTLRVTVAAQAAYPYLRGRSKRIHVWVRG
jgi:hypothetical protein